MKPFIDICQGFWPDMQLEGLLNIYFQKCSERTLSVTASGSTKIIKLSPKSLETSFFSWNIRLTIDKFRNKKRIFWSYNKSFGSTYPDVFSNFGLESLTESRKTFTFWWGWRIKRSLTIRWTHSVHSKVFFK